MWFWLAVVLGSGTAVWALSRWRPSFRRLQRRDPEAAALLGEQLINHRRYGTEDGLPQRNTFMKVGRR